MDKDTKNTEVNTELTGKAKRLANLKPAWKKGEAGGGSRPLGQRNYETIRREAIIAIGKQNGKTDEEIEVMLVAKGISEALKGDYRFYKDDLDRTHGQATQKTDLTTGGDKIVFMPQEIIDKYKLDAPTPSTSNNK